MRSALALCAAVFLGLCVRSASLGLRARHEWLGAHVKSRRQQAIKESKGAAPSSKSEGEALKNLSTEQEGWGQSSFTPKYSTHKCMGQNWHNGEFQKPYYTKSCHFKNFCYDADSQRWKYYRRPGEKKLETALRGMDGKSKRWEAWPDFLGLKVEDFYVLDLSFSCLIEACVCVFSCRCV
jgi:hypothetical protein